MREQSREDLSSSLSESERQRISLLRENEMLREAIRLAFVQMGSDGRTPAEQLPQYAKALHAKMSEMREVLECLSTLRAREWICGDVMKRIDGLTLRVPLSERVVTLSARPATTQENA